MSKFFFRRKKRETIEPATSGEISEAELPKDVQKMREESQNSTQSLERDLELEEESELDEEIDWVGGEPDIDDFIVPEEVKPTMKHTTIEAIPDKTVDEDTKKAPEINIDANNLRKELNKLKDKENELPDVRNKISMNEIWINGTPDGNYALRILRAYRRRCNERWMVEGFPKERRLLYDAMNEHQEQRAKELDRAIALLEKKQI